MPSSLFYPLLSVMGIVLALLFLRATLGVAMNIWRYTAAKGSKLRLSAPNDTPTLYIEAQLMVIDVVAFRTQEKECQVFLHTLAKRQDCAGHYEDIMEAILKAQEEYCALPATDTNADILCGARLVQERIQACVRKHFDNKLKFYGLRIGIFSICAIGTKPPQGPLAP